MNMAPMGIHAPRAARNRPKRDRTCLRCTKVFRSDGAHNRLCQKCGTYSASPFESGGSSGQSKRRGSVGTRSVR